MDVYHIGC